MKHLSSLISHLSYLISFSLAAAEVVVYSPASDKTLHLADTNGLAASFSADFTGHRALCLLPGAPTNNVFHAWLGASSYAPGDPFGSSAGRPFNAVDVTPFSPVTPRFSPFSGSVDRSLSFRDSYEHYCRAATNYFLGGTRYNTTALGHAFESYDLGYSLLQKCVCTQYADSLPTRLRIVRTAVDGIASSAVGVDSRVVFDRILQPGHVFTEEDVFASGEFDLDWSYLESEVVDSYGAEIRNLQVVAVDYLAVIGEGPCSWLTDTDTNKTVNAMPFFIRRRFEADRSRPTALPVSSFSGSRPVLEWRPPVETNYLSEASYDNLGLPPPDRYGSTYTAFCVRAWSGTVTNVSPIVDTGYARMPPVHNGLCRFVLPYDLAAGETITWCVFACNAKFKSLELDQGSNFITTTR